LELFCNAQQYYQTGVSWLTVSWLKHSDWPRWWTNHRKYYPVTMVIVVLHVRLAIKSNTSVSFRLWWIECRDRYLSHVVRHTCRCMCVWSALDQTTI